MLPLRLGSVPYLNARPLVHGLDRRPDVIYSEAVPSLLAQQLAAGALDAALVSSIESLFLPDSQIVGDHCIGTDGPAWSVKLLGRDDPARARSVALDGASLTAATLTRVAYRFLLDRTDVTFVRTDPAPDPAATGADATLVIGDAALRPDARGWQEIDLGELWTARTGLPFVWAVWLARSVADRPRLEAALAEARRAGRSQAAHFAAQATDLGIPRDVAHAYLTRIMRYEMGPRDRQGLALYLKHAGQLVGRI